MAEVKMEARMPKESFGGSERSYFVVQMGCVSLVGRGDPKETARVRLPGNLKGYMRCDNEVRGLAWTDANSMGSLGGWL
jgi:hypothetical protein